MVTFKIKNMSFRTRNEEKSFTPYKVGYAKNRISFLAAARNDMGFRLVFSVCFMLLLSACGNNSSSANTDQKVDSTATTAVSNKKAILFFGDSLTAGYGLDDPSDAFPGVIQRKIDSLKLPYMVVNAGVSGETTAGGLGRIDWTLKQKVDIFILELGANDGLRGIPAKETGQNLQAIVDKVKAKYPDAKLVLLGMQVPPSMGADYATNFKTVFPQVAEKNKMALVPFLLQGVGGNPKLNQADGIHPTAEGAKIVADNVWQVLKEQL
jgi:acyl-CoA thioesterase-1